MQNQLEKFWAAVKADEEMQLATALDGQVTMRTVSPVYHQDAILIFTGSQSLKYQQLQGNPRCCFTVGGFFVEAKAELLGPTMQPKNEALRQVYAAKFSGAFDEGIAYGGRDSDFVLFRPVRIKGWIMENGMPQGPFEHTF